MHDVLELADNPNFFVLHQREQVLFVVLVVKEHLLHRARSGLSVWVTLVKLVLLNCSHHGIVRWALASLNRTFVPP